MSVLRRFLHASPRLLKDPWPLPHTPEHLNNTQTPSSLLPLTPILRPNESLDAMRARLVYQSRKRGTLESDLLLSTWATQGRLKEMEEGELREYDKLLDEPDWDIYYWCTGKRTPPDRWANSQILDKLRVHAKNEGRVLRVMPALSAE